MTSQLASQLAQLGQSTTSRTLLAPKAAPSFIYTKRQAAQVSTAHLGDIAQSAYDLLASLSPVLERYQPKLLSPSARTTDRTTLSQAENEQLDSVLEKVLRALGDKVLLKPTGVVLEWLIRRFRIQELNSKAVLALILPYHSTAHFAALLALIPGDVLQSTFPQFISVQKSLAPLPLHSLVALLPPHDKAGRELLEFLLLLPTSYLASNEPIAVPRVVTSFWLQLSASFLSSLRNPLAPGERALFLSTLLSTLRFATEKEETDVQLAAFVLLARFTLLHPLAEGKETETVAKTVAASKPDKGGEGEEEAWLTTLVVVLGLSPTMQETEGRAWLGKQGWRNLLAVSDLKTRFNALGKSYDLTKFMTPFLSCLVTDALKSPTSLSLLHSLTSALSAQHLTHLTTSLLSHSLSSSENADTLSPILKQVYQRHPTIYESCTASLPSSEQESLLQLVLGAEMAGLMLSLGEGGAPSVQHLDHLLSSSTGSSPDQQETQTLLRLLQRGDPKTLNHLLSSPRLSEILDTKSIIDALAPHSGVKAVQEWYRRGGASFVQKEAADARKRFFWSTLGLSDSAVPLPTDISFFAGVDALQNQETVVQKLAENLSSPSAAEEAREFLLPLVKERDVLALKVYISLSSETRSSLGLPTVWKSLGIQTLDSAAVAGVEHVLEVLAKQSLSSSTEREKEGEMQVKKDLYRLAHTGTSKAAKGLGARLLAGVFLSLGPTVQVVAFLTSFWSSNGEDKEDARMTRIAIKELGIWIVSCGEREKWDWQALAGRLVLALGDEREEVRRETVGLLGVLKAGMGEKKLGEGWETENDVTTADFVAYLDKLLGSSTELIMDPSYLTTLHSTLLDPSSGSTASIKKKYSLKHKISSLLLSQLLLPSSTSLLRTRVLKSLEDIKDGWKAAGVVKILQALLKGGERVKEGEEHGLMGVYRSVTRKWLEATEGALETFQAALEVQGALRKEALSVVRDSFFALVRGETRLDLFRRIVRLGAAGDLDAMSVLRSVKVDVETFTAFIKEITLSISSPVSKGAKRNRNSLGSTLSRSDRVPELTIVLENVVIDLLVPTHEAVLGLFDLLSSLVEMGASSQVDVQYPGQLVLGALGKVVKNVEPSSGISTQSIRMGPVLDFMRATANPQTSQQALLLLAQLGPLVPDQLVHNVMPIFTLMGANVLQRDDAYSLRVVEQTIESIVPALVKSMKKTASGREGLVAELKELIQVFTDAASHVPRHRRVQLFVRFVEKLGPREFLAAVAMLLLSSANGTSETSLLSLTVLENFSVDFQLLAVKQVVEEVAALAQSSATEPSSTVLTVPEDEEEAKAQLLNLVHMVASAFESRQLGSKIDASRAAGDENVDTSLSELVRSLLDVACLPSATADLQEAVNYSVQAAVRLMSAQSLSEAILWLLDAPDQAVQASALALLRSRLPTVKASRRAEISPAVVVVVEKLLASLAASEEVDEESLATLDVIVASPLAEEDTVLAKTPLELLKLAAAPGTSRNARVTALEVVKKLTSRLGPRLIPLAAKIIRQSVDLLYGQAKNAAASSTIVTLAFQILEGLFIAIPTFIGTHVDVVFKALLSSELAGLSSAESPVASKARAGLISAAAKKLPAKSLYPAIIRLHAGLETGDRTSMMALLDLLNRALRHGKPADVAENYRVIFKLFLNVFDLRRLQPAELSDEDVDDIEDHALGAFVQLVLKLNEQIFRPLFLRTFDWAVIDLAEDPSAVAGLTARRTVLFKLVDRLLTQLKSIVVPYFSFMLDQTIELLDSFAKGELHSPDLWVAATSALTKALEFDENGFWTPLRLNKLASPIATQLQAPEPLPTAMVISHLHPLIKEYSHALQPHEKILKAFNTSLLMMTRSDDLRVKRSALEAMEVVWESLGDGMLGLVPETTPFLAETLEEVEGGVEATTRRLITRIEQHLGETLDSYLK